VTQLWLQAVLDAFDAKAILLLERHEPDPDRRTCESRPRDYFAYVAV
jgi:hypothetical protein